jgi:hypothetical protein
MSVMVLIYVADVFLVQQMFESHFGCGVSGLAVALRGGDFDVAAASSVTF